MSGLDSALARIGAIERRVTCLPAAAVAVRDAPGAGSFAAALDQATRMDAGATTTDASAQAVDAATEPLIAVSRTEPTVILPARLAASAPDVPRPAASAVASYRPAHVTETDERVWNDCTWASAAMWIDKLTGGKTRVDREALRAASGDRVGGSSLGDVVRGARRLLGLDLRAAHDERLTFRQLLDRLADGGGAIVQGSYSSLPSHLTRHDPGFAAKGTAGSGHAVYVGPLDRATGKVWWDDPLAPAAGSGEWISVRDLRKFAWTDGQGRVSALATPAGAGSAAPAEDAATVSAAAWTAGVDPQLLAAYLDVAEAPSGSGAATAGATDLAIALRQYGRADLALESLGAARPGSARLDGGAAFAGDVLREWAERLDRPTEG